MSQDKKYLKACENVVKAHRIGGKAVDRANQKMAKIAAAESKPSGKSENK